MTINKDKMKIPTEMKNQLELFYANSDFSPKQKEQLEDLFFKYYNEGFQNGRVDILMQQNLKKDNL